MVRKRRADDVGGNLPRVKRTIELGGFAQAWVTPALRLRVEGRKGVNGHEGWTGDVSADAGLPAFDPGGGVRSVGLTVGYLRQLDRNWGIAAYARYDRLVGDAAKSPVTRAFGSRNQPSAGLALSYTFGGKR